MKRNRIFHIAFVSVISGVLILLIMAILSTSPTLVQAGLASRNSAENKDGGTLTNTELCTETSPILIEPANEAVLDTLIPEYVAEQVSDEVTRVNLQVSHVPDFSSLERNVYTRISNPTPGGIFDWSSFENLEPDTTYYWRVAHMCGEEEIEGPFSTPFSFRSAPPGGLILPPPDLLAPDDGANVGSTRVFIVLGSVVGAKEYTVRRYHNWYDEWEDSYFRYLRDDPLVRAAYLDPDDTVYWRAAAVSYYAIGEPTVMRSFNTPPIFTSTLISPATGGILIPEPGNISIYFPSGAVTQTTTISYTLLQGPATRVGDYLFAGRAFTFEATNNNGVVTSFNQPFTLTVTYDPWDLFGVGIEDPSQLNLVFWDGSEWEEILSCDGCWIDTENHTVTVVPSHITEFYLVAPEEKTIFLPFLNR